MEIVFVESAFIHGYDEDDFLEVLAAHPLKMRSRRGLEGVYEVYGANRAGDHLHIAYRRRGNETIVFHMRRMSPREKRLYRKNR
jgi:hypothetical protein